MSSWQKVEKRRDRRERKRGQALNTRRNQIAFVEHILKEYKNKPADWKNLVPDVVNEVWTSQRLDKKNADHVKEVLQRVTSTLAAPLYSYKKEESLPQVESKDPSETGHSAGEQEAVDHQERDNAVPVAEASTLEENHEQEDVLGDVEPMQDGHGEEAQADDTGEIEGDGDQEEEKNEHVTLCQEKDDSKSEKPALTLAQQLAEEAKSFDILTHQGVQLIIQWTQQIQQNGEAGETYRTEFYKSNVLKSIVQALLTEKPNEKISGTEEVIALFHATLQGNDDYHRWLYNQIRKLADYISKTSKRTHPEWMQFLQNQAFIIVDAQKDVKDSLVARRGSCGACTDALNFVLPTTGLFGANAQEEALKTIGKQADTSCKDMLKALSDLHDKDNRLLSMTPSSNSQFKDRYAQVTGHLEQHISKANAHILAQQRNLEKINEQFRENERRSKDEVQPVQEQLRSVQHQTEQTNQSVLELEARLKSERQKLQELNMHEQNLKSQIQKIKAQHHPPRADLTSQRNNCQFKLHSVHREQNCYTHLRHIAMEAHKHLVSWSQCNITRESDTRRLCLKKYYDQTEKYVTHILQMLQFLLSRIQWMQKKLRNAEEHNNQRKAFYGAKGTSELEAECMERDRQLMDFDRKIVNKLQVEVDKALNTACTAAYNTIFDPQMTQIFIHYFSEVWTKVSTVAAQLKVNLNFVNLKAARETNRQIGERGPAGPHIRQTSHAQHERTTRLTQETGLSTSDGGVSRRAAPLEIVNDTGYQRGPTKPPAPRDGLVANKAVSESCTLDPKPQDRGPRRSQRPWRNTARRDV